MVVAFAAVAISGAGWPDAGVPILGGTAEQRAMAAWAIERFDSAGLTLPPIEIRFHLDRAACRDRFGYYEDGVASQCRRHTDLMAARELLHELAHGWLEVNVTRAERGRFLELRGLRTWNGKSVDWNERGFEHGAEIMAWTLGDQSDGIRAPSIPDNDPAQLAAAYELLTGDPLPELERWMVWRGE